VNKWKGVLIRFAEKELETLDIFCQKNMVKRTDLVRNATRLYVANPDVVNGVVKLRDNGVDIVPILDGIAMLAQKVDTIEKGFNSAIKRQELVSPAARERIIEAILRAKQKTKKNVTTVDRLREQIKRTDPSLEQFLYASASDGIPPFDDALIWLQQKGELSRNPGGIIEFNGDSKCV